MLFLVKNNEIQPPPRKEKSNKKVTYILLKSNHFVTFKQDVKVKEILKILKTMAGP